MKSSMPINSNEHPSYQLHRKQLWTQILLPIIFAALVFIAIIIITSLGALRYHGDVGRWAAISTIWLTLPVMIAGLIFLILLIVLIYLLSRVIAVIPPYSYQAQSIVYRIESIVKRFAEMFRKPMLAIQELTELVRAYIDNLRKANSG
jgi:Na+-transporting methylmalonyl-CoA/oxaloacetate decarboxylase gamma subunit